MRPDDGVFAIHNSSARSIGVLRFVFITYSTVISQLVLYLNLSTDQRESIGGDATDCHTKLLFKLNHHRRNINPNHGNHHGTGELER